MLSGDLLDNVQESKVNLLGEKVAISVIKSFCHIEIVVSQRYWLMIS